MAVLISAAAAASVLAQASRLPMENILRSARFVERR